MQVTKEIFLKAFVCPSWGWLIRSGQITKTPTIGERFRMEQGIEVGRRARDLYPMGILINESNEASASKKTKGLMDDQNIPVIFEGTFCIDGFEAKANILRRENDGWHIMEVKSGVKDKEEFIDDMAYTAMVIERSGHCISNVSLLLVSEEISDLEWKMKNCFRK